jgi:hypothetical protein
MADLPAVIPTSLLLLLVHTHHISRRLMEMILPLLSLLP